MGRRLKPPTLDEGEGGGCGEWAKDKDGREGIATHTGKGQVFLWTDFFEDTGVYLDYSWARMPVGEILCHDTRFSRSIIPSLGHT